MATVTNKSAVIQVRVNAQVKKKAQNALKDMGLDISTAVNMLLHQVVITQRMPFEGRTANGFTREQEQMYLKETEWALKYAKRYDSVDELMDSIK